MIALAIAASSCGEGARPPPGPSAFTRVPVGAGRPPISAVEREGDARGALAFAVSTEAIAPERGATAAVALGALVEERLAAAGITDVALVGGWNGWRMRTLVASPTDAARIAAAAREAMLAPVAPKDPALATVARKVTALMGRPLPDRALADVAECTGEPYGAGEETPVSAAELETWRRAAHGLGRVAIAVAGEASVAQEVARAMMTAPAWPKGAPIAASAWPPPDARTVVYDASGEILPGAARIVVTARTTAPERAVAAAVALGDPHGPLASRLGALDAPARVRSVVASAHVDGGCLAATLDLSPRDLASSAPARIATAAALARQEIAVEVADVAASPELPHALATRASDPRDAAERAAWWALAGRHARTEDLRVGLTVGVAAPRDALGTAAGTAAGGGSDPPPRPDPRVAPVSAEAIIAEIDRATLAWHAPVVEARTRVERGQGEAWVLLASTCGTLPETAHDAGAGAAVATASAAQANGEEADVYVDPFVSGDGIGVLAHGPPRAGESPQAHARRLADVVGRAFAADTLDADRIAHARTALLARAGEPDARALAALAAVLAPGRPSWVAPLGTTFGLGSASDEGIAMRAAAIRAGPLRVGVLANTDSAQADAAVRAIDRWVARRPGEARSCPPLPALPPARAGTYAVDLPVAGPSQAILAVPLPGASEAARAAAAWIAASLDGPEGLLARAVGGDPGAPADGGAPALAQAWSAAVVGAPRSPALVVRLIASDASLDAAVAQTRMLLDRLQRGAIREQDRARAGASLARNAIAAALDPRARTISAWRGESAAPSPSLEALRAFASSALHDDALVIVAERLATANE
jgi:hypothetical protein